jgi:hypothetical protein
MSKRNENELKENIRKSLDDSVDTLDANTLSKIRQIRAQAVEKAETGKTNSRQRFLVGGLATACIMVLAVMLLINSPTSMQTVPAEDLELISSSDNLDLFEELEFYEWLEEDGLPS